MKLLQWCKEHDKLSHFTIISIMTLILYFVMGIYNFIPITIISVGKEVYDDFKKDRTGFDTNDLITDYLAYIITTILILLV